MNFVDRKEETARLHRALGRQMPSLIVIYGRRRLGKSTLIKKVLTGDDIYFVSDLSEEHYQRALLSKVIAQTYPDFDKVEYPDWESLLRALNYRADGRFTLCLDEFPYLVKHSPELPSVLQKLIDERSLKYNIILCGSSQSMMYNLILDAAAPLYGRADEIIRLTPIGLPYIQDALNIDANSAIEEYSIWGGVPRYWELRALYGSMEEALWGNVLSINGPLYEEPAKLLQDDVQDIVKTSTILSYIGTGSNRISEIAARCGEPTTNLSRPLKKLVDLGYIEREVPFGVEDKNAKKSLYKLADPFMAFHYRFVVPNRSFIELGRSLPIQKSIDEHLQEYISLWWEKYCRDAITGSTIDGITYGRASRWWGTVIGDNGQPRQEEIDIVALSLDSQYLLVGECKWTSTEYASRLSEELLHKARLLPFAQGRTIIPMLFLKTPPRQEQYSSARVLLPQDILCL